MMAPIVILTYGSGGEPQLRSLLRGAIPDIFCTQATGIIPACHAALRAWQRAEGRRPARQASPLAVRSVRAMADSMTMVMAARHGGRVWCETASAGPPAVHSFLAVIPDARVICLHRSCEGFVGAILNDRRPDPKQPQPDSSVPNHLDRSVAAISSRWAACETALLQLESQRRGTCVRVRFEDLMLDPDNVLVTLSDSLGLGPAPKFGLAQGVTADDAFPSADPSSLGAGFPADQLPGALAEEINFIHSQLGYPQLPPVQSGSDPTGDARPHQPGTRDDRPVSAVG
jgi:Sulfotransferase family